MNDKGKETATATPTDDEIKISKEDFSKLSYRQIFAVTEYGYLLSIEDAEVVGKMLGSLVNEKDILQFCHANGKKVYGFKVKNELKSRNDELIIRWIAALIGLIILVLLLLFLFYMFVFN